MTDDRIECRTPTAGKQPTRIERWKFDAMREAILAAVPAEGDGVPFQDLPWLVEERLDAETLDRLGSLMWYLTTVKLELEVRGELRRAPGRGRQRLLRGTGNA
jgi:hypothetical protein